MVKRLASISSVERLSGKKGGFERPRKRAFVVFSDPVGGLLEEDYVVAVKN
jgi:hypothetical protein